VGAILAYFLLLRPILRLFTARFAPAVPQAVALQGRGAAARGANSAEATVVGGQTGAQPAPGAPALGSPEAGHDSKADRPAEHAAKPGMPVVPLLENYDLPPTGSSVDVMVDHLKILAEKEPERVAEVVKQWMQKNGRTQ
jgi:flagellar M-ring protein FliF